MKFNKLTITIIYTRVLVNIRNIRALGAALWENFPPVPKLAYLPTCGFFIITKFKDYFVLIGVF